MTIDRIPLLTVLVKQLGGSYSLSEQQLDCDNHAGNKVVSEKTQKR